jgi:HAD superfamily hydrolase (TIGR01450 family)
VKLSGIARAYDHLLIDLDGCLWVGDELTERAADALSALRDEGKGIVFLTNNVRWSPEDFVRKLWRLGVRAAVNEVVTAGAALQYLLAERNDTGAAFVIGSQALVDHVATAGMRIVNNTPFAPRADVVVVGGHDAFDYRELRIAAQAVLRGAELIGTNRDASFPMPDGPWPASGAVLAAVEVAAGRTADRTIGKPEAPMYETALDRLGPGRALAVGDRLEIDVAGARAAGIDAALVLTGGATREEAEADGVPSTHVAASLAELVLGQAPTG